MDYCEFIQKINEGKIAKLVFSLANYSHYKDCSIEYIVDNPKEGVFIKIITLTLTSDKTERVSFYKFFDEKYKLFDFKRKGKFTLKQVWDKIIIKSIEESKTEDGGLS